MDTLTLLSFLNFLNSLDLTKSQKHKIINLNRLFLSQIGKSYIFITYFDILKFLKQLNKKDFYDYIEAFYYFFVKFLGKHYNF